MTSAMAGTATLTDTWSPVSRTRVHRVAVDQDGDGGVGRGDVVVRQDVVDVRFDVELALPGIGAGLGEAKMMRRWVSVAAVAGFLGLVQGPASKVPGLPEPIPFSPQNPQQAEPNLIPGPLNPAIAPQGPPSDLSLPNDNNEATFPAPETEPEGPPSSTSAPDVAAAATLRRPRHRRAGPRAPGHRRRAPPANSPVLQSLSNVDPRWSAGPRHARLSC